ncbi:MAG: AraC family transcriptional regulator [Clostridia bacterium]|jgi:AraC family cel operon transcriptional repressor
MEDMLKKMREAYRAADVKLKEFTGRELESLKYYQSFGKPRPFRGPADWTGDFTPPERLEESFFFEPDRNIILGRHSRYEQIQAHSHAFLEILYIYQGHIRQIIDNQEVELNKGDVCIIGPGVRHCVGMATEADIIVNILVRKSTFDTAFFGLLVEDNILTSLFTRMLYHEQTRQFILFHTDDDYELRRIILEMVREYDAPEENQDHILKSWFMLFCGQLLRKYEHKAEVPNLISKRDEDITEILQYIQTNYQTATLSKMAKQFYFDEAYLSRMIKEYTGENFRTLLRNIRVNKAAALLKNPYTSMEDIAEAVGYREVSSFYRNFKAYYGITPAEYREQVIRKSKADDP